MKKYDSVLVAQYLMAKAAEKDLVLNVTKTQKLLFLIYGYYLSEKGETCIDETPKAWPYGPVFPKTRKKVNYGILYNVEDGTFDELRTDELLNDVIDFVLDGFHDWTASELSSWSHKAGSPWHLTTKKAGFNWNDEINDNLIEKYFSSEELKH